MASTRARRSSGVSSPVTASMRSFGKALRRPAATWSAVAMKRQNTTGLAPSAISGLSTFTAASSFGSGALVKLLGLRDEGGQRTRHRRGPEVGSTSTASPSSAVLVEHLLFEPIRIGGEAVAQCARGGGGRRADAPHQRQRAPECKPAAALIGASALDDAKAIVEHGIVECSVVVVELVGPLGGLVAREDALLAPVAAGDVDPPPLHEMAREPRAVRVAVERAFGKSAIEQAEQPIEGRLVAAVRRRGEQDQMALAYPRARRLSSSNRCCRL